MTTFFAVICVGLMVLSLILLFLSLPGNWVILGLMVLWSLVEPQYTLGFHFMLAMAVLAAAGEVLEFLTGTVLGKRFGGTGKGSVGGIVGAIIGAILCAPVMFGLGALPGALAGAFIGTFIVEKLTGMETNLALKASLGTMLGRFGGFIIKLGIGLAMIALSASRIFASLAYSF